MSEGCCIFCGSKETTLVKTEGYCIHYIRCDECKAQGPQSQSGIIARMLFNQMFPPPERSPVDEEGF